MNKRAVTVRVDVCLFAVLLTCAAGSAGAQVITEFYAGVTNSSFPTGITAGPDGNMWFTETGQPPPFNNPPAIGRITPAGVVTEFREGISPNSHPNAIALGPDGNLWFTEIAGRIGRITPEGVVTEFSTGIRTNATPIGITAGPDGNLWFTEAGFGDAVPPGIGRITTDGVVTEFLAGITANAQPIDITAGPDGNLWFTQHHVLPNIDQVARITTAGVVTEFSAGITAGASPVGITAGPDGNLWFAEKTINKIGRITTAGVVTEFGTGIFAGAHPVGITAGPDGNLWFTENGLSRIGRITPLGEVDEFGDGNGSGALLAYIAAGPDGNLWFTEGGKSAIALITTGALTIVSVSPTSGPSAGGTPITVSGDGFVDGATVTIGGVAATNVDVVDVATANATTPALTPGTLNDVTLTNPDTSSHTLVDAWFADFLDVPQADIVHPFVEYVLRSGITAGCGGGNYCRNDPVKRKQMAVFLLKAKLGASHVPPAATGTVFNDVSQSDPFAPWIEELAGLSITGGCGGGNYCPESAVRRDQMAVFLLKAKESSSYDPPDCTGVFQDVPCTPGSGFPDWIEELYNRNVTGGCIASPLQYCPLSSVLRGQMAVFLEKTFNP